MLFDVLVLVIIILIFLLMYKRRDYWKERNVVQVKGIISKYTTGDRSLSEYIKDIYDAHNEDCIGTFMGSKPALILKNLKDVQAVLRGDFHSFYSRGVTMNPNDVLGDNVLFIDDFKRWKILRQKMTPVFTSLRLKNMTKVIEKCGRDFVKFIEDNEKMRDKPFDALYTYTTASIGAAILGVDVQSKDSMNSPFLDMAWKALKPSFKVNFTFFIGSAYPRLFRLLNLKFFGEHEKFFVGAVKKVFDSGRNGEIKTDFIDVCLDLQRKGVMRDALTDYELEPTDELLAAQAFFFFIAGADTTANTMHFTLLELSSNPKILTKVHEEIDNAFRDGKKELTYNDLEQLQYLDMVVNEAMRKYPTISHLQRICTKDTVLPSNNLKIDQDTIVIVPTYALHNDKKFYPNPDSFDPERFASNNLKKIKNFSYLPFGGGHRNCIGTRFARLQVKAGLAWLLRRFTLSEQCYKPKSFEQSSFSIRDTKARYQFIARNI